MSSIRSYYSNYPTMIEAIKFLSTKDKDPLAIAFKNRQNKHLTRGSTNPHLPKFKKSNIKDIEIESNAFSSEDFSIFGRIRLFMKFYFKRLLKPDELEIITYLEGSLNTEAIKINQDNASKFLKIVKLIDLAISWQRRTSYVQVEFKCTSFEIRSQILKVSSLTTAEAYTTTMDPSKFTNPQKFIPERVRTHARIIANQWVSLRRLSIKLGQEPPKVIAIKGNTGVGKTFSLEEYGVLSGSLNPDIGKAELRKDPPVSNKRVYGEWTNLFWYRFLKNVSDSHTNLSFVIDSRLIFVEDLETYVIEPAKKRGGVAEVVDIDAPLETSLVRVLTRDPKAPRVAASVIVDGFLQTRKHRLGIIDRATSAPEIKIYKLFLCTNGKKLLVGEKREGTFKILLKKAFSKCLRDPLPSQIDRTVKRTITDKYIDAVIAKKQIFPSQRELLERWKGFSLEKALAIHADSI